MKMMRALVACLVVTVAHAEVKSGEASGKIDLHDLPGTNGEWQEGVAIIPAPRDQIRAWLIDYPNWPKRFPDIGWSTVLPDDAKGRHVVRFSSHIVDAIITVHEAVTPNLLVFEGTAPYTHTQGRIHLIDLGDGTTKVLMQSTAEVHGFYKIFATKRLKRDLGYEVSRSHLRALYDLATKGDRAFDMSRGR
jgi:hypothetical protein